MTWFAAKTRRLPAALRDALGPDEQVLSAVPIEGGALLAATRFGLWTVGGEAAERTAWHLISKARLTSGVIELMVADVIDTWPDGTDVLIDRPSRALRPIRSSKLTDHIHTRVRHSVAASHQLHWAGAGGWVVLRRVAGRDGLIAQVRLDAAANPAAPGFADAVAQVIEALWPADVERTHPQQ